jgi:AraC family transcriptional regulator, transcriptional activator of pobA
MMKKGITPFNWRTELVDLSKADSIDDDFILLEKPIIKPSFDSPFKVDVVIGIICIRGTTKGRINLKPYTTTSPGFITILPGQILEHEYMSEDFSGLFIVMSKRFTDSLNIQDRLPLFLSRSENSFTPLTEEALSAMMAFYSMLQRAVRQKDNPYRMEIVQCLIKAFFYSSSHRNETNKGENKSKNEVLVKKFLSFAQTYYKEQRGMEFYADKMCLTPKYLSKVVKEISGTSASQWIDNYVVLEAKVLLKSTNMTIQQISDELNFPSQSFFGKYFKRHVGVSPKEYKKKS